MKMKSAIILLTLVILLFPASASFADGMLYPIGQQQGQPSYPVPQYNPYGQQPQQPQQPQQYYYPQNPQPPYYPQPDPQLSAPRSRRRSRRRNRSRSTTLIHSSTFILSVRNSPGIRRLPGSSLSRGTSPSHGISPSPVRHRGRTAMYRQVSNGNAITAST